jgi:hypothetical protein
MRCCPKFFVFLVTVATTTVMPLQAFSQINSKAWNDLSRFYRSESSDYIVANSTFNKIVKKDLEYAIVGDNSPASGVSIDLSSQTKIKINGRISAKKGIHTIEVEASQKNSEISFFQDGSYNGQLEVKYNWNYIPLWNNYNVLPGAQRVVERTFREKIADINGKSLDTVIVVIALFRVSHYSDPYIYNGLVQSIKLKIDDSDRLIKQNYPNLRSEDVAPLVGKDLFKMGKIERLIPLVKVMCKKYFPDEDIDTLTTWSQISIKISESKNVAKEESLLTDFKKSIIKLATRYDRIVEAEIKAASPFWLRKKLYWFTITPSLNYQAYQLFEKNAADSTIKTTSTPFFAPRISGWFSTYHVFMNVSHLWRFGIEAVHGNNFKSFVEVKFMEKTILETDKNGNVVVKEKETEGIARKLGLEVENSTYFNLVGEYYRLPNENFKPGFAFRVGYIRDGILVKNYRKLSLQASIVLNVMNKDKDKAVVTILPYIKFDYLTDKKQILEADLANFRKFGKNLSIGVTVGLPIKGLLSITK